MLFRFIFTQHHLLAPRDTRTRPHNVPKFPLATRAHDRAHARANDADTTQKRAKRHSHACAARREGILSRLDGGTTRRGRRTRPCAVHERARMSTAGGAGGRRAQGEANGQQMGCCGCRACPGDGVRGSAGLQGVRRGAARAGLCHCQTARSRVLGRWYSSPFDDLASLLPSTALLNHKGKQRGRFWGQRAGHTGFCAGGRAAASSTLDHLRRRRTVAPIYPSSPRVGFAGTQSV